MKTHPMLFSAPMVQALLDGRKTQTRRILKPVKDRDFGCMLAPCELAGEINAGNYNNSQHAPNDLIWVRERIAIVPASAYRQSTGVQQTINPSDPYNAAIYACGWDRSIPKWKPSIHMPRWASRLMLKITDVPVERLQDISRDDAIAEGAEITTEQTMLGPMVKVDAGTYLSPKIWYRRLWDSINDPGAWDKNPWIIALTFQVIKQNIHEYLREVEP